jgi:hypothetical protein
VHTGWLPAQKGNCQCNCYVQTLQKLWHAVPDKCSIKRQIVLQHVKCTPSHYTTWRWEKLQSLAEKCSPILLAVRIWPMRTTNCSGPYKIAWGASIIKTTRESRKPCVHTSIYRSCTFRLVQQCQNFGEQWRDISGNSRRYMVLYMYLCLNIK